MCTDIAIVVCSCSFRLQGSQDNIVSWGHEYLRNLAGEIGEEYQTRRESQSAADDLFALVKQIAPHHMAHNAEPEAVDLLLEVRHDSCLFASPYLPFQAAQTLLIGPLHDQHSQVACAVHAAAYTSLPSRFEER